MTPDSKDYPTVSEFSSKVPSETAINSKSNPAMSKTSLTGNKNPNNKSKSPSSQQESFSKILPVSPPSLT